MKKGTILCNQIVVKEIVESETTTSSGLVIPKQVLKKPNTQGIIVLVGEEREDDLIKLREGMTVLYPPMSAQKFVLEGEELHLVPKSRVLFAFE